uniref:RNA-directed DNA polymerase n=1 Tax=Caenorhabditis japonica TaxID=281687 RepID=A0A8R1DZW4_CAEJA
MAAQIAEDPKFKISLDSVVCSEEQKSVLLNLFKKFSDVFSRNSYDLGSSKTDPIHIYTNTEVPVRGRPYRVPVKYQAELEKHINGLLLSERITESNTPWISPIVLVPKKNGSLRVCLDFRKLNEVTIPDNFPLPRIDSILEKVGGSKFFSSLDMANGYLQLRLDPESSYKCGFVTEDKVYAYTHLPFGLRSAASYFQRAMRTVLAGMEQDVMMYIDDVLVFSKSFESHVKTLRKVLTRFREYNLKASPAKCEFAKKSIVFLGHEISETNYSPNQANLDTIEKMPIPRDLRAVQRFVGMAGFFRKFIKNFSEIAEPLTKLTRKEQKFEWTSEQQQAFEILKEKLTSKPILAYPDYTKEFHIYTDASAVAQGAVLAQVSANEGNIQVVAYGSRTLSEVETRRPAIQIELGAIVFALRHFKPYIWLSKIILHTDHRPLVHILAKSKVNERIARWLIEIQQYDITIVHIDGKKNTVADCISRAKDEVAPLPTEELEDIIEFPVCMAIDRSKDRVPKKFTPGNTQKPVDLALEQDKDSDVNIIKTFLTSPATTIDGISEKWLPFLERVRMSKTGILTVTFGNDNPKVVIPHTLQKLMFESFHTSLLGGGHFDWRKTLHKAQKKYFWPGMRADFLKWTLECLKCQQKRNPHPSKREPQLVVVTSQVFEKVGIDLTGPLRTSLKGNKYYINMICWFSKFVISVPLPDATCETISRAVLEELVLKFGTPNQIVSDNASSFTSAAFQQFCSLLKIGHHRAIPHHSKGNGATERTFRTFHAVISKYINKEHSDWDTILPFTTFSYNNTVHSTTGETPFFLVFGRDPTLTIDRIIDPAPATKRTDI